jgi:hypothetical protein
MKHTGFSTVQLNDWQEFKHYLRNFSQNWAFRGQANAKWILNNAIERTDFIQFGDNIEAEFLAEFQRGARNYLSRDETPQHLIEWLALMQHHGAPTRLLDLTKSPFIAGYFAFESCLMREDQQVAIWCVNIEELKQKSLQILGEKFSEALKETDNLINETLFEKVFFNNSHRLVFPVEPFRMNRRYSLQQSIFISTGTSDRPLMEQLDILGEDACKIVVRIELPSILKKEVLRELQQMNLNRASLFPDLDGYALSLRLRYDNMQSPREKEIDLEKKINNRQYPFYP